LKKVISIALAVSIIGFVMQVSGENGNVITYDNAKETLLSNNRTIKKLDIEQKKMFYNYNSTIQRTKNMKTRGVSIKAGGMEFFYKFSDYTQLNLTMAKEYQPEEVKNYWKTIENNKMVTKASLTLGLRDLYLGLMKADKDIGIAEKKLELYKNKHSINKLKFDRGLITKQDLEESEYELLKAEKGLDEVNRNRENMVRSLNSLLGVEISTEYDMVKFDELKRDINLKPLEYYIENALKERIEIKNIEEEIRLKELKQGIIAESKLYGKRYDINDQYEDLELEIETLNIKMEKTKFDIENELKKAYIEIKNALNDLESTSETIEKQNRSLDKLKTQYEKGFVSKIILDEMQIGIEELENSKNLVIYDYNTKIMKLEEAAGIGPAYYKE